MQAKYILYSKSGPQLMIRDADLLVVAQCSLQVQPPLHHLQGPRLDKDELRLSAPVALGQGSVAGEHCQEICLLGEDRMQWHSAVNFLHPKHYCGLQSSIVQIQ